MLHGRTVTVDTIIEQLIQDYGFESADKAEVVEWVWRSMSIIGSPEPYEDKARTLKVSGYRTELPLDYYSGGVFREKSTGMVLREMTDRFNKFGDTKWERVKTIIADYNPAYPYKSGVVDHEYYNTIVGPDHSSDYFTYKFQGNMVYFGFDKGEVEMQYKAIPIDIVTGMPVVPENATYMRGVVSFIAERMAFRMMLKDLLSKEKYEIIRQDSLFNIGAARNICILPTDPGAMETMINRWKSTYLGPEHFDLGNKFVGSRD